MDHNRKGQCYWSLFRDYQKIIFDSSQRICQIDKNLFTNLKCEIISLEFVIQIINVQILDFQWIWNFIIKYIFIKKNREVASVTLYLETLMDIFSFDDYFSCMKLIPKLCEPEIETKIITVLWEMGQTMFGDRKSKIKNFTMKLLFHYLIWIVNLFCFC